MIKVMIDMDMFATSEVVELGILCLLNLDFRDISVSPKYIASHSSHFTLHAGPTAFSFLTRFRQHFVITYMLKYHIF